MSQAGLFAGAGGFNVNVAGNTNLVGAVISSSADPSKNAFSTGTLTTSDLTNTSSYAGQNASMGVGYSSAPDTGYHGLTAQPPSAINANGKASSTTSSGISAGTFSITNAAGQQALTGQTVAQTLAGINTVTTTGPNTLAQNNLTAIQEDMQIAGILGTEASQFAAYEAAQIDNLRAAAKAEGLTSAQGSADTQKADALEKQWGFGGTDRNIFNAVVGAISGNATGSLGQLAQGTLGNYIGSTLSAQIGKAAVGGIPDGSPLNVILHSTSACAAAIIGGQNCESSALGAGVAAAATNLFPVSNPNDSVTEKQNVANLIATIAGAAALTTGTSNVANAISAATASTENNYLGKVQREQEKSDLGACQAKRDLACIVGVLTKYHQISTSQDKALVTGLFEGAGDNLWGIGSGLWNLVTHIPETLGQLKQIFADPKQAVAQFGQGVVDEYNTTIQDYNNASTNGGDANSEKFGKDLGNLLVQLATIGT